MASTTQEMKQNFEKLTEAEQSAGKVILHALQAWVRKKEGWIKKITWMSGSNGERTLPMLKRTGYTLRPTGTLLDQGIAPLGGELEDGMSDLGCNQTCLSGVAPQTFDLAWGYANYHKDQFNFNKIENEKFAIFSAELDKILKKTTKEFTSRPDGHANAHFAFVGKFSILILQLRQLNESRYQAEFVTSGKIEKLKAIVNNDNNFNILKDKRAILLAFSLDQTSTPVPEGGQSAQEIIEWNFVLEDSIVDAFYSRTLVSYIQTLKVLDPKYIEERKNTVIQYVNQHVDQFLRVRNRLLKVIEDGPIVQYSETIQKEMAELGSLPVIFATRAVINHGPRGMPGEVLHKGDIECDLLITNQKNQLKLKQYLAQAKQPELAAKVCTDTQFKRVFKL